MLNPHAALVYIERIEKCRAEAEAQEIGILNEFRAEPDYERNSDKDLLEAIRLRAEARQNLEDADTLINAFDWVYDEATGENVRKQSHDA